MHVFLFWVPPPPGRGKLLWLASLACLKVGKSAGHQLASPADVPTQVSQSASNPNRLVISRQMFGDSQLLRIQFSLCVSVRRGPSLVVVDFSYFRLPSLFIYLFFSLASSLVCWLAFFFLARVFVAVGIAWPNHFAVYALYLCRRSL